MLPEQWEWRRLKHLLIRVNEKTEPLNELPYVGLENIASWTGRYEQSTTEQGDGSASAFVQGDVLFGKLRPYLAKAWLAEFDGRCTAEALVFRTHSIDPAFLRHMLLTPAFIGVVDASTYGAKMPRAEWDYIGNIEVPVPPIALQRRIADFLDRKTAAIDEVIAKKERLALLLQEKRQAVITQAVTKGLDPGVRMKESGIEWIGQVPEHWEVMRLKYAKRVPFQYGANEAAVDDNQDWPRFIRITDLDTSGGLRDETFRSLEPSVAAPYLLNDGDILFARSGATVGKAVRYRSAWGAACFAGYLIRFRPAQHVDSAFVELFTQSEAYWEQVRLAAVQATIENVSAERYGQFLLPLPPLHVQHRIVAYMQEELYHLDRAVQRLDVQLAKLREYRQSLITAAVTGKISVGQNEGDIGDTLPALEASG